MRDHPAPGDRCIDTISEQEGTIEEIRPDVIVWTTDTGERRFHDLTHGKGNGFMWRPA